jgi:hypothetical protein
MAQAFDTLHRAPFPKESREGPIEREAARILSRLICALHATEIGERTVKFEGSISSETYDRLCVWGSASEDFEQDDFPEDDADREAELHA